MAEDMLPKPSVGRIVHYRDEGSCIAAIITEVVTTEDDEKQPTTTTISILTFHPDPLPEGVSARRFGIDQGLEEDTWHWPERV